MRQDWTSTRIEKAQEAARQRIRDDRDGAPPDVVEILEAIESGLFDPDFGVGVAQRACGATQTAVQHFTQHFTMTMKDYIRNRLLEVAGKLLDDVTVNPCAIAAAVGFRNGVALSRWLERWTQESASERRRRAVRKARSWPVLSIWIRVQVGALRIAEVERLARVCARSAVKGGAVVHPPRSPQGDAAEPAE